MLLVCRIPRGTKLEEQLVVQLVVVHVHLVDGVLAVRVGVIRAAASGIAFPLSNLLLMRNIT